MWGIASRFQALGMNLSLSSNNILQLFLISFHIGEHFNAVPCPSWGMNLFLPASVSSKYSCDNPWPSEDPMIKKNHTLQNILKFQNVKFEYLHSYIWILIKKILRLRLYLLWMKVIDKYNFFPFLPWRYGFSLSTNQPLFFRYVTLRKTLRLTHPYLWRNCWAAPPMSYR